MGKYIYDKWFYYDYITISSYGVVSQKYSSTNILLFDRVATFKDFVSRDFALSLSLDAAVAAAAEFKKRQYAAIANPFMQFKKMKKIIFKKKGTRRIRDLGMKLKF